MEENMKQTTQKFLAKLMALLLVLGLAPEAMMPIAEAATGNNINYIYYAGSDTTASASAGSSITLSTYGNGVYPTSRGVQIVQNSTVRTCISWGLSGTTYAVNGGVSNGIVTLTYNYSTGQATITANSNYSGNSCTLYAYSNTTPTGSAIASCTVYVNYNGTISGTNFASVVVDGYYYLGERDANGGSSIVDQLTSRYYNGSTWVGTYGFASLSFTSTTSSYYNTSNYYATVNAVAGTHYTAAQLSSIMFSPGSSTGTAYFPVVVRYYTNGVNGATAEASGYIAFDTRGTTYSGGDIPYSAAAGQDVSFYAADFENFYYEKTRGTLNYVTFTSPSYGTLYSDRGRLSSGTSCYARPTSSQTDLDGVYFSPNSSTRNGTVRINFTAYGSAGSARNVSGTVVITYTNGSAADITYTALSSGSVNLRSSDFTNAYRNAVGGTAPSNMTIVFQDVPANGTLTYSGTTLRSNNIKSYKFRTSGSTTSIDNVTFTSSGGRQDTIDYTAYNGSTALFTGRVVFNPTTTATNLSVVYTCGSSGTAFDSARFTTANAVVMGSTTRVRFVGAPTSGTMTYGGVTMGGAGTDVTPSLLSSVYYRPAAGFNGTATVAFICYDASGNMVGSGQVNIVVSGNGSTNTGATSINQFTDVSPTAWYRTELADLVSKGIMGGKGNGKFDPLGEVKYGEALKMVLRAAGYTAEEVSGDNWAINYKNLAVSHGWVSNDISLTSRISRNQVAELVARVLGLSVSTAKSPFKDNANGYAVALYYTSPRIIQGNDDNTFKGGNTLQRAEICRIIYQMNAYVANTTSNTRPDGI